MRGFSPVLMLCVIAAAVGLAPALAPFDPLLVEDAAGARCLPPLTSAFAVPLRDQRIWVVTRLERREGGFRFSRAGGPGEVSDADLAGSPSPRRYLLGTDGLGRDLASRLLHGLRSSATLALICTVLAIGIGLAVGGMAALGPKWIEVPLMAFTDLAMSVPRLLVVLVCAATLPPSRGLLIAVVTATSWTGMARLARADLSVLRHGGVAMAARSLGAGRTRVALRHLLPSIGETIAVGAALRFADTVLLESALGFLGLSAPPPWISLGGIVGSGREVLAEAWWVTLWPGLAIAAAVLIVRSLTVRLFDVRESPSTA